MDGVEWAKSAVMKRHLSAAAMSIAIVAPITVTAGDVTLYGLIHITLDHFDIRFDAEGPSGANIDDLNDGSDDLGINPHCTNFGVKGVEDLGNGLSVLFQM